MQCLSTVTKICLEPFFAECQRIVSSGGLSLTNRTVAAPLQNFTGSQNNCVNQKNCKYFSPQLPYTFVQCLHCLKSPVQWGLSWPIAAAWPKREHVASVTILLRLLSSLPPKICFPSLDISEVSCTSHCSGYQPILIQIPLVLWLWLLSVQKPSIQQSLSKLVVDHPPKYWNFLHNSAQFILRPFCKMVNSQ